MSQMIIVYRVRIHLREGESRILSWGEHPIITGVLHAARIGAQCAMRARDDVTYAEIEVYVQAGGKDQWHAFEKMDDRGELTRVGSASIGGHLEARPDAIT